MKDKDEEMENIHGAMHMGRDVKLWCHPEALELCFSELLLVLRYSGIVD